MTAPEPGLQVEVCYVQPDAAWLCPLVLDAGATVADAIAASGFVQVFPGVDPFAHGVSVYGVLRGPEHVLVAEDRVEILRPLRFDPRESRRRRAEHKATKPSGPRGRR